MKGDSGMWSGRPGCWRLLPRDPRRTRLTATPSPNHSANAQLEQADASGCESSKIGVPFCRDQLSLPFVTKNYVCGRWILPNCKKCTLGRPFCTYRMAPNIPHPLKLKCMERGGGREFFIHFHPSETGIFVWTFFCKIEKLPKEVGGVLLIHFQHLASKACLEKGGEAVSYIDFARPWIFDAHGIFLGILRNSMTLLSPPLEI